MGSVDKATFNVSVKLYVKVPIFGRVNIATIAGSLRKGVTVKINVAVASGSATLSLQGKVLYIELKLKVKFIGNIGGKYKLLTLP